MIQLPQGPFDVILADPPWHYNSRADHRTTRFRGGCRAHYDVMRDEDLAALDVASVAAPDCLLFLWATHPRLDFALKLIAAWGFRYTTVAFTWVKVNPKDEGVFFGVGYYTKSNPEPCLLASRGRALKPAVDDVSSVVVSPLREHSRKPDAVRARIDRMYPTARKVELFARDAPDGWVTWGNQADASPFGQQAKLFTEGAA